MSIAEMTERREELRMRKKLVSAMLSAAMIVSLLTGCGGSDTTAPSADAGSNGESAVQEESVQAEQNEDSGEGQATTIGSSDTSATEIELWTFTELFQNFYETMANKWNEQNPDQLIRIKVNVMPYDDMHNKLQIVLNAGAGAPDFADVEIGKFAIFMQGDTQLMDMTEAAAPYRDNVVESRLGLYSKDGKLYGLPTHVGATVAFYNTKLLEEVGIDYKQIKTWEDFKEAGSKYYEATGKNFGNCDTNANWMLNAILAQEGADYMDENEKIAVNSDAMVRALTLMKELQDANAISVTPGGQPDTDEGYAAYAEGEFAAMVIPFWMGSRFLNYMTDLSGQIAMAPVPVIENSKAKSVGGGGTGTVVIKSKENAALTAEFLAFAKLSEEASIEQWETLGNDPCNMAIWSNTEITQNPDNQFLQYYVNNPFDVLNEIEDGIALLHSQTTVAYPSISNEFNTITLNAIFEDGQDIREALDTAQMDLENELE